MAKLSDYLDSRLCDSLNRLFSFATGRSLRIMDADGRPLAHPDEPISEGCATNVVLDGEILGHVHLEDSSEIQSEYTEQILAAASELVECICLQGSDLSDRIEELQTLYKVTALFTGQQNRQDVLDAVVKTVVEVLGVKACTVRLLKRHTGELFIKATYNLSEDYLNKGVILLTKSTLDRQAMENDEVVYVADERTDPRVLFPDKARSEGIVSALIAPLNYNGEPVGVLRLYTSEVHEFTNFEISLTRAIAAQAAAAIVNSQLNYEKQQAELTRRQLKLASEVQRRMIPLNAPDIPGFEIGTVYVPSLELCGDFYDFMKLDGGNYGVSICDVMGKGIPAGLLTASIRASLRAQADNIYDLSEVLSRVNRSLHDDTLTTSFATLFYGVLDTVNRRLTYTNAGHEPPLLIRDSKSMHLNAGSIVLGVDPSAKYPHKVVELCDGDVIILTTDGIIEASNFDSVQYGRQRLEEAAIYAIENSMCAQDIAKHILWDMRRFTGLQKRDDDITLVVIKAM